MKRIYLIISLFLVASAFQTQAQNGNGFNREIGFTTGVMVPMDKDFGGDRQTSISRPSDIRRTGLPSSFPWMPVCLTVFRLDG